MFPLYLISCELDGVHGMYTEVHITVELKIEPNQQSPLLLCLHLQR
jgi:hypothetical protein